MLGQRNMTLLADSSWGRIFLCCFDSVDLDPSLVSLFTGFSHVFGPDSHMTTVAPLLRKGPKLFCLVVLVFLSNSRFYCFLTVLCNDINM
jgi:hypothetical protein